MRGLFSVRFRCVDEQRPFWWSYHLLREIYNMYGNVYFLQVFDNVECSWRYVFYHVKYKKILKKASSYLLRGAAIRIFNFDSIICTNYGRQEDFEFGIKTCEEFEKNEKEN